MVAARERVFVDDLPVLKSRESPDALLLIIPPLFLDLCLCDTSVSKLPDVFKSKKVSLIQERGVEM